MNDKIQVTIEEFFTTAGKLALAARKTEPVEELQRKLAEVDKELDQFFRSLLDVILAKRVIPMVELQHRAFIAWLGLYLANSDGIVMDMVVIQLDEVNRRVHVQELVGKAQFHEMLQIEMYNLELNTTEEERDEMRRKMEGQREQMCAMTDQVFLGEEYKINKNHHDVWLSWLALQLSYPEGLITSKLHIKIEGDSLHISKIRQSSLPFPSLN
jgi:hypothetical protein